LVVDRPGIDVVAAVVERDGHFLITQRQPMASFPLYWEFPGGKVEPGEDDATALRREMMEELNAVVEVGELVDRTVREQESFTLDFRSYRCNLILDHLECRNVHDLRWVTLSELDSYSFPPADLGTIVRLSGRGHSVRIAREDG
jgi:8-oxo-dGTP diphosphatase